MTSKDNHSGEGELEPAGNFRLWVFRRWEATGEFFSRLERDKLNS